MPRKLSYHQRQRRADRAAHRTKRDRAAELARVRLALNILDRVDDREIRRDERANLQVGELHYSRAVLDRTQRDHLSTARYRLSRLLHGLR
jgi:hypothetical protein